MNPKLGYYGNLGWVKATHEVTHTLIKWSCDKKRYIFIFTKSMTFKLSKVVTQDEGTTPKSHVTLWSRGLMLHRKRKLTQI